MSHRAFDGYITTQTGNGIDGYTTTIRAQNATGTGSKGGNLILAAGTGISSDGYISLRAGLNQVLRVDDNGVTIDGYVGLGNNLVLDGYLSVKSYINVIDGYVKVDGYTTIDGYEIIFDGYAQAPFIRQTAMPTPGVDGYHLSIRAQASTTSPAHGGDLKLYGGDGYNGDGYFRDGYVRLYSGSSEQVRVVPNKFSMLTGQRVNLSDVGTTPFSVPDGYFCMLVDTTGTAITINLPNAPTRGDTYEVKDVNGTANTNNITVSGNGHNIDANPNYVISANYGMAVFSYNGTKWSVR